MRKMKFEELLEKEPYRSIIKLTHYFQHKDNGLRQLHYRWALIENHDEIKDSRIKDKMNDFFMVDSCIESNLIDLIERGEIKKDSIKGKFASNNLNNYLNRLIEHYGILKKVEKNNHSRYFLTNKYLTELLKTQFKNYIDTSDGIVYVPFLYKDSFRNTQRNEDLKPIFNKIFQTDFKSSDELVCYEEKLDKNGLSPIVTYRDMHLLNIKRDFFKKLTDEEIEKFNYYFEKTVEFNEFLSALKYFKTEDASGVILYFFTQYGSMPKIDKKNIVRES